MPDISLLFGVQREGGIGKGSEATIRHDLQEIVKSINSKPFRIKFEVDETSLEEFKSQLKKIEDTIPRGNSIGENLSNEVKKQEFSIIKALNARNKAQKILDNASSAKYSGKTGSLDTYDKLHKKLELYDTLLDNFGKKTEHSADEIKALEKAMESLTETAKTAEGILIKNQETPGTTKTVDSAVKKYKEYLAAVQLYKKSGLNDEIGKDENEVAGNRYSFETEGLKDYVNLLNRLDKARQESADVVKNLSTEEQNLYRQEIEALEAKITLKDELLRRNQEEENSALINKATTARNKAQKILDNASSAKYSGNDDASTAYERLASAIRNLDAALKSKDIGGIKTAREELEKTVEASKNTFELTNNNKLSLFDKLKSGLKQFTEWFSIAQAVAKIVQTFKKMISTVIEIDTAMTELKKVTNETDKTYDEFLTRAVSRAKQLGAQLNDVATATADFARLGYNLSDAEAMADAAMIYKNVGDGIENVSEASESLISTLQAFSDEVSPEDVMIIVDKFNEIGNSYAISSEGIGEALLRSAAAMKAANNTLDETIALATAANTIIQNPETVGTTLKTVSMYLRAAKTEAEEAGESTDGMSNSVSELRREILALTGNKVDIQIDENNFKSTYQILKELSEVWDNLSDITQANIIELVGGKRNSNVISALLNNFSIAESALKASQEAEGSALAENKKYLDSIEGHIAQLKTNFQELSTTVVDGDVIKFFIDFGAILLKCVNGAGKLMNSIGGLKTLLVAVAGTIATINANSILKIITNVGIKLGSFSKKIENFNKAFKETYDYMEGRKSRFGASLQSGMYEVGIEVKKTQAAIAGISLALTIAMSIYNKVKQEQEEARQEAEISTQAINDNKKSLEEYKNTIESLKTSLYLGNLSEEEAYEKRKQLLEIEDDLIEMYGNEAKGIDLVTGSIETQAEALENLSEKQWQTHKLENYSAIKDSVNEMLNINPIDILIDLDSDSKLLAEIENAGIKLGATLGTNFKRYSTETLAYSAILNIDNIYEAIDAYQKLFDIVEAYGTENKSFYAAPTLESISEAIQKYKGILEKNEEIFNTYVEGLLLYDDRFSGVYGQAIVYQKQYTDAVLKGDAEATEAAKQRMEGLQNTFNNEFSGEGWEFEAATMYMQGFFNDFFNGMETSEKKTNNLTESVHTLAGTLSELKKLKSGFEQLDSIYLDVLNGQDFDFDSLIDDDFKNSFGSLDKYDNAYTNFINTIANSPKDINTCQEAFNKLAAAYVLNTVKLDDLEESERDVTIAYLKQMGVANAAVIVDKQLEINKAKLKYSTEDLTFSEWEEAAQKLSNVEATELEKQALAELLIEKMRLTDNQIDTAKECQQILNMANAARASTADIQRLVQAKRLFEQADAIEAPYLSTDGKNAVSVEVFKHREQAKATSEELREQAKALANQAITYDKIALDDVLTDFNYTGGSSTSKYRESSSSGDSETWFERQLKDHQHLVAMEQETEADYLNWLNKAYKQAYSEGIIELDDYYKYQEEAFEGLRDLFKDGLSDVEHEISMRENYDGEEKKIISLYQGLIEDVEKEIANARAQGLTDEDDYIQELQEKWQDYTNAIKDIREEVEEAAKDALDEMIDYRVDMLKQEIEDEKDALDKKLDNLKEFYDKQKEMLQDKYDEEKYLEDQAEKRKSVSDIKAELSMLANDDSAWAQKRKLELQEELTTAEKDLADFEKENALDKALDAIDEAYNSQEAQLQREMKALDEKLNDPNALFNQALEDIKNNSKNQLYYQMLMYNRQYGLK